MSDDRRNGKMVNMVLRLRGGELKPAGVKKLVEYRSRILGWAAANPGPVADVLGSAAETLKNALGIFGWILQDSAGGTTFHQAGGGRSDDPSPPSAVSPAASSEVPTVDENAPAEP